VAGDYWRCSGLGEEKHLLMRDRTLEGLCLSSDTSLAIWQLTLVVVVVVVCGLGIICCAWSVEITNNKKTTTKKIRLANPPTVVCGGELGGW
jgi:hypothetical protein